MPTKSASKTITRDPNWLGPAIPPGEILLEEYLKPLGLGQLEAAKRLGISLNRLNEIVLGKRGITADTALRLARLLKTSPQLWMRLQADWDLHEAMQRQARGRRNSCSAAEGRTSAVLGGGRWCCRSGGYSQVTRARNRVPLFREFEITCRFGTEGSEVQILSARPNTPQRGPRNRAFLLYGWFRYVGKGTRFHPSGQHFD